MDPRAKRLIGQLEKSSVSDPSAASMLRIVQQAQRSQNLSFILPLMFQLKGEPLSLKEHYPFEICYDTHIPKKLVKQCARQVGKSLGNVSEMLMFASWRPYFNQLYVTPFFEMVRRLSSEYVRPMIENSIVKSLLVDPSNTQQVLQRSLKNGSTIYFSYAHRDPNRIRGANTHMNRYDEVQIMLLENLPIIQQTMSGSPYGNYEVFSGTPLTPSGTLSSLFKSSTMSEWVIPCWNCKKDNVASTEFDLVKMIGPLRDDIRPENPGIICAKCQKPIFTEHGHWWHRIESRRDPTSDDNCIGIHLPQPVMPWHCGSRTRWSILLSQINNPNNGAHTIYNEIFGEPYDGGARLVTEADLERAANLELINHLDVAIKAAAKYKRICVGVDWGGGSLKDSGSADGNARPLSRTKIAVVGLDSSGQTHVIFGCQSNRPWDRLAETKLVLSILAKFRSPLFAYDIGGGGLASEDIMTGNNFTLPEAMIRRVGYTGSMKQGVIAYHKTGTQGQKAHYSLDKARSLIMLCTAIKGGMVRFFPMKTASDRDLLSDFTNLIQEESDRVFGVPLTMVHREPGTSDDFVHAVNFACQILWSTYDAYPDLSTQLDYIYTTQQMAEAMTSLGDQYDLAEIESYLQIVS